MVVGLVVGGAAIVAAASQELSEIAPAISVSPTPIVMGPVQNARATETANSINPLWTIPITSLGAPQERPIFSPSRRPLAPVAPISAPVPTVNEPLRPSLSLVGAVAGETDGIAIFRDETTKSIVRMKTGESRAGWILRQVKGREATLQKDRETAVLAILNPSSAP
jgi:general secretion pathway protein N